MPPREIDALAAILALRRALTSAVPPRKAAKLLRRVAADAYLEGEDAIAREALAIAAILDAYGDANV